MSSSQPKSDAAKGADHHRVQDRKAVNVRGVLAPAWAVNLILLCGCAVSLAFWVSLISSESVLTDDPEELKQEIRMRLAQHSDEIAAEAGQVASEVIPPLSSALWEQVQEDQQLYARRFSEQGEIYFTHLREAIREEARSEVDDYLAALRGVLEETFPELAGSAPIERLLEEFRQAGRRIAERYHLGEFEREVAQTAELWNRLETLPPPSEGQPSLEEQLTDYLKKWVVVVLSDEAIEKVLPTNP